ncbi:SMC-Scp complex subunit ScpB [Mycolicibacterium poriferae]|uniref:SMC-Scp complex subunit ScpB n=1 Tax=Mycolicibacterium poriferae TaxID=39694 RepID=UPI00321C38F0
MSQPPIEHIVEAALLAAGRPLAVEKLRELFDEDALPGFDDIRKALEKLAASYQGRAIELREVASGWRLQTLDTAAVAQASVEPLRPLSQARGRDMKKDWERNYVHSLDWRWLTPPLNQGPGESWLRPEVDLVKGETMTALERLFAVADDANGIGAKLDIRRWTFLNTDLVVHIHREPDGEWIGIRAETSYGPDGIGVTSGTLFDESGPVGAIQQSVLVRPRPPREESAKTRSS